jgi:hypothetical protein
MAHTTLLLKMISPKPVGRLCISYYRHRTGGKCPWIGFRPVIDLRTGNGVARPSVLIVALFSSRPILSGLFPAAGPLHLDP